MMNYNLVEGILIKSLNDLKKKTTVNCSMTRDKIKILKEAQQQAHGISLVYRSAVYHNVHLEHFENDYVNFLDVTDKRILELEEANHANNTSTKS